MPKPVERRGRCTCGATFELVAGPDQANAYEAAFWQSHDGEGHGKVELGTAEAAPVEDDAQGSLI